MWVRNEYRQSFPDGLSVWDWASKHNRYMAMLKKQNVRVHVEWMEEYEDNDGRNNRRGRMLTERQTLHQSAFDLMVHAIYSWCKRCVQDWKPTHFWINESIEEVMEIFSAFVQWMVRILRNWDLHQVTACPMQLDISFVFDEMKVVTRGMQSQWRSYDGPYPSTSECSQFTEFTQMVPGDMLCSTEMFSVPTNHRSKGLKI